MNDSPKPADAGSAFDSAKQYLDTATEWVKRQSDEVKTMLVAGALIGGAIMLFAGYVILSKAAWIIAIVAGVATLIAAVIAVIGVIRQQREAFVDCPTCGERIRTDAEFCIGCSRPMKDQAALQEFLAHERELEIAEMEAEAELEQAQVKRRESQRRYVAAPPPPPPRPAVVVNVNTPAPRPVSRRRKQQPTHHHEFVSGSIITLFAYIFVLTFPLGLLLNVVYYLHSRSELKRVGSPAPGHGCLVSMFWVFILLPCIAFTTFIFWAGFGIHNPNPKPTPPADNESQNRPPQNNGAGNANQSANGNQPGIDRSKLPYNRTETEFIEWETEMRLGTARATWRMENQIAMPADTEAALRDEFRKSAREKWQAEYRRLQSGTEGNPAQESPVEKLPTLTDAEKVFGDALVKSSEVLRGGKRMADFVVNVKAASWDDMLQKHMELAKRAYEILQPAGFDRVRIRDEQWNQHVTQYPPLIDTGE